MEGSGKVLRSSKPLVMSTDFRLGFKDTTSASNVKKVTQFVGYLEDISERTKDCKSLNGLMYNNRFSGRIRKVVAGLSSRVLYWTSGKLDSSDVGNSHTNIPDEMNVLDNALKLRCG